MTLPEAIARYLSACKGAVNPKCTPEVQEYARQQAHAAHLEIQRLQHQELTPHETLCHEVPAPHYGGRAA